MLLAADGHDVTVVERDGAPPPRSPDEAWDAWERPGVNQFRMLHWFQPRFRQIAEVELPGLVRRADEMGVLRKNPLMEIPPEFAGPHQPGDERFEAMTARRPVMEAAIAAAADDAGVTVR